MTENVEPGALALMRMPFDGAAIFFLLLLAVVVFGVAYWSSRGEHASDDEA